MVPMVARRRATGRHSSQFGLSSEGCMEALGLQKYMDSQTSVNPSNHKYNLLSKWDVGPPNVMVVGLFILYSPLILELFRYHYHSIQVD